ncbi:hypothetical protein [Novosphingobium sp. SG720]|uniref:hypothetical protein n=1 Tax=Novosphingobium sp. SG720 TaxID=2586998 RepID=UPI0014454D1B|nr:hypothetical protein [Novosphingobium sp. SG720]NKJ43692.1 hypothetical protein [Novosphingobium sp. SG720]
MIASLWARAWLRLSRLLAPLLLPLLLCALILSVGGWIWQTVRIDGLRIWPVKITGLRTERDQWRSAEHDWRRAATIMRGSYDTLHGALQIRNAAVQRLKADGEARKAAGKTALVDAAPRNATREALARAIDNAPPAVARTCRTPDAVMAAKGEL